MITTVIGSITANVPAIGIGMTLIAAGALAQASNRHAEKQTNNPEAQISPEIDGRNHLAQRVVSIRTSLRIQKQLKQRLAQAKRRNRF